MPRIRFSGLKCTRSVFHLPGLLGSEATTRKDILTCRVRTAPRHTAMMTLLADRMRRASTWSSRVSTLGTGVAIVREAGTPTVMYTTMANTNAATARDESVIMFVKVSKEVGRGGGGMSLHVQTWHRAGEMARHRTRYLPREDPSKYIALSSHLCTFPIRPMMPTPMTACSNAWKLWWTVHQFLARHTLYMSLHHAP